MIQIWLYNSIANSAVNIRRFVCKRKLVQANISLQTSLAKLHWRLHAIFYGTHIFACASLRLHTKQMVYGVRKLFGTLFITKSINYIIFWHRNCLGDRADNFAQYLLSVWETKPDSGGNSTVRKSDVKYSVRKILSAAHTFIHISS